MRGRRGPNDHIGLCVLGGAGFPRLYLVDQALESLSPESGPVHAEIDATEADQKDDEHRRAERLREARRVVPERVAGRRDIFGVGLGGFRASQHRLAGLLRGLRLTRDHAVPGRE